MTHEAPFNNFDAPYDKAMRQVEELAYYANSEDDRLKRLLKSQNTNDTAKEI